MKALKRLAIAVSALAIMATGIGTSTTAAPDAVIYKRDGIWCERARTSNGGIVCVKSDGTGYGIAFTRNFVIVQNSNDRTVFQRIHP